MSGGGALGGTVRCDSGSVNGERNARQLHLKPNMRRGKDAAPRLVVGPGDW